MSMRLDLNLATRPYEDARSFWLQWGARLAAVGVLTLALLLFTASAWRQGRAVSRRTNQARQQITSLQQEKEQAEAILARPGNHEIGERSAFLNSLIARKAFSWTQVFAELETIMPPRLHVVSITPDLTEDNRLEVRLRVAADNSDPAIELVKRMEGSPHFRRAEIVEQTVQPQSQAGGGVEFEIVARYTPAAQKGRP
jgi:type IV pilus assembly protein PilN